MKVESMVAMRANQNGVRLLAGFVVWASVATLSMAPTATHAADPGGSGSAGKSAAVTFEDIPGSTTTKRVILTTKAAARLGIEIGKITQQPIVRKQMVGGQVIPPLENMPEPHPAGGFGGFGGFGQAVSMPMPYPAGGGFSGVAKPAPAPAPMPAGGLHGGIKKVAAAMTAPPVAAPTPLPSPTAGEVWVQVTLSPGEWERLAQDKSARLLPLPTRDELAHQIWALPSGIPPIEDVKRSMLTLYYKVPGQDHGLTLHTRMRVELQIAGSDEAQRVVPYSAVYYDGKGAAWVYVNTKPLAFERQRVGVERVIGDLAVLSDGPPVGTPVVTVGAALLYGAEVFGK